VALISAVLIEPESSTPEAIDAVTSQEVSDLEVVAVSKTDPGLDGRVSKLVRAAPDASPAALRNMGIRAAAGRYVCVLEPGEALRSNEALASLVDALEAEPQAVASYGRTEVEESPGNVRARPAYGRGGLILRRLVQHKGYIASSASIAWRRAHLPQTVYDEAYRTPMGLLLALLVRTSAARAFVFQPTVIARVRPPRDTLATLEESVKVFVALLYGADPLDERVDARVRFRLARHLVALGKYHYRKGDHSRAGKLFAEAVKAAPVYFKGRRYQFMNFLKGIISRS
jgi:hypothetical protein